MARDRELRAGSIASIVLGASASPAAWPAATGPLIALVLHATVGGAVLAWSPSSDEAPRPSPPLRAEHEIESAQQLPVAEPPPPAPTPPPSAEPPPTPTPPPPAPPPSPPNRAPAAPPSAPAPAAPPPPPAAAGQVVAADPAADALDFSDFDIATSQGSRYSGGVTARSGTGTQPAPATSARFAPPGPATPPRPSLARSVGAPPGDWSCPWPRQADDLSIDEQVVVIRVVVRPDGTVARAELLSDPGSGFGEVALSCARSIRFQPATDADGRAITAISPPVHVRFTR